MKGKAPDWKSMLEEDPEMALDEINNRINELRVRREYAEQMFEEAVAQLNADLKTPVMDPVELETQITAAAEPMDDDDDGGGDDTTIG